MKDRTAKKIARCNIPFIKFHLEILERWSLEDKESYSFFPHADLSDVKEAVEEILIALHPKTYCWKGDVGNRYLAPK